MVMGDQAVVCNPNREVQSTTSRTKEMDPQCQAAALQPRPRDAIRLKWYVQARRCAHVGSVVGTQCSLVFLCNAMRKYS